MYSRRSKMVPRAILAMASWALAGALLCASASPVLASDEDADEAAAEEQEHQGGHGHGGPIHFSDIFRSPEFWGAVINFTLLVWLLRRYGAKPLRQFLVSRRAEMEREIAAAAEVKAKAEAKYQEYSQRLAQLDQELAQLRKGMETAAAEDRVRILAEADETARRLRRETETQIDQYTRALTDSIRREIVGAAMAQAEKLLREAMTDADQQRLAQSYVARLDEVTPRPAPGAGRTPAREVPQEQS
jgi:F-type H+-transporting ATPase subunit b